MFCADVTPRSAKYCIAASNALSATAGGGSGTASSSSPCALSLSSPVGSPFLSRTITPPSTAGIAFVTFAAASARPFASPMWPSSRLTHTGLSGVTESIQWRVGSSPPQRVWSQSPSVIHAPFGTVFAKALMRAMNSAGVDASRSFTIASPRPALMMWVWLSMNPGTSICPCASTTFAPAPVIFRISALEPTAAMRSPRTAIASAHGRFAFPVQMRALTTASVAGALFPPEHAGSANANIMVRRVRGARRVQCIRC